jgi:hypothetical protein
LNPYPNYAHSIADREKTAAARVIAEEYGVPFTDFNIESTEAIGLDYSTDFADVSHMNHRAVRKFNLFFGEWLDERHKLPDRRGEPSWQAWQNATVSYEYQIINQALKESTKASDYLRLAASSEHLAYIIWVATDEKTGFEASTLLSALGFAVPSNSDPSRYALVSVDGHETIYRIGDESTFYIDIGLHTVDLSETDNVLCDRTDTKIIANGVNVIVIDLYHDLVIDKVGINSEGNLLRASQEAE